MQLIPTIETWARPSLKMLEQTPAKYLFGADLDL